MNRFEKVLEKGNLVSGVIGATGLAACMLVTVANVLSRVIGSSLEGTYEIVGYLSAILVSAAFIRVGYKQRHIVMEIFISRLHGRAKAVVEILTKLLSLVLWAFIGLKSYDFATKMWIEKEAVDPLYIPTAPFRYIWALAITFFCVVLCFQIYQVVLKLIGKR